MKKILNIVLVVFFCAVLAGCVKNESANSEKNELVENFSKVSIGMTKNELNNILSVSDEANGKYENGKITVSFNGDKVSMLQLQLSYNNEEVKNSKTNLSKTSNFKSKLDKGTKFYYQDLVDAFKTEGVCTSKNSNGCSRYNWADNEGNYATFSLNVNSDGYVVSMSWKA